MKAAVLEKLGTIPVYGEFPEPKATNEEHLIVNVKAASIKQLDKSKASGKHYTSYPEFPTTVGVDGTGVLADGTRIYALGISGMLAEKAIIKKDSWVVLPEKISFEIAAALPNALIGSDIALLHRAEIKKGDVVLINGATGVTGQIAAQMAKYRGASKVIVTGRNEDSLLALMGLGTDESVNLKQSEEEIVNQLDKIQKITPIDIVLDYLWGRPIELILSVFEKNIPRKVKVVTIGEMAGATINLTSGLLRSKQVEILGSGIGSVPYPAIFDYMKNVLPDMFKLAAEGKLKIDIELADLKDVENAWKKPESPGKRLVVRV